MQVRASVQFRTISRKKPAPFEGAGLRKISDGYQVALHGFFRAEVAGAVFGDGKEDGCPAVPLEAGTRRGRRGRTRRLCRVGDARARSCGLQAGIRLIIR